MSKEENPNNYNNSLKNKINLNDNKINNQNKISSTIIQGDQTNKKINITMNNLFLYNQLKNNLSVVTKENTYLKSELMSLRNKVNNLESDKICQKKTINDLIKTQNNLLSLQNLMSEKDQTINNLKEQIISDHKNYNDELRYKESKFDYELIQSKIQYDQAKYKIENYLKIENFSDALYKRVLEMEDIINNFNKIEESNMNKKKIEYINKLNKFKKKVLDFLKDEINCKKDFSEQLKLSNLVNNLHIKELIKDIEELNNEVSELLEEKQELKYKIFCLVNDIEIYRKVIDTVVLKNNTLQKRLFKKNISTPIMIFNRFFSNKKNIKKNSNNEIIEPTIETNSKLMKLSNSLSFIFDKNNKKRTNSQVNIKNESLNTFNTTNISLNKYNSTSYFNYPKTNNSSKPNPPNNYNTINNIKNKNNCYLLEKQTELIQEKEKYKKYFEYYKDKYYFIRDKYNSIFKIYNEALEKIFNEDLKKENEDIFINLNDIKNFKFDYEKMNTKEKYFILIKLIKHISPLICKKEFDKNLFCDQLFNVEEKYVIGKDKIKSVNFNTENNGFDLSLKLMKNNRKYKFNKLKENYTYSSLKIIDKKHKKFSNLFKGIKNRQRIFMHFNNYFNIQPVQPLDSLPYNDFNNGPFSSI